jgi:hypothetical protein
MPENADSQVSVEAPSEGRTPSARPNWLLAELPYIAMLVTAFVGTTMSGVAGRPMILYWEILVPIYALFCMFSGWPHASTNLDRSRLVWTQALHWLGCFVAMRLLFLPELRGVVNDNATGLTLLTVLALGAFLAGLHARTWRICVVGALVALSVPAAAWLEQSALLLFGEAILVVVVAAFFVWARWKWQHRI